MPEILAVIPVSGQDPEFRRGVPVLRGRPLLEHTFEAVRESELIDRAIVSTDDRRIAAASRRAGMEVPFVRPRGSRRSTMADVVRDAVEHLESRETRYRPDWVVRLQVTYPFRERGFLDRAIRTVLGQNLDSAFTAFPEFDTFWHLGPDGQPARITTDTRVPRARRTPIYRELGGLFSIVRRSVLAQGTLHGTRLGIISTESVIAAIDVHATHGFDLAELVAGALNKPAGRSRAVRRPAAGRARRVD